MTKAEKIRLYFGIFLSVLTVVVGAVFIIEAADIYYSGVENGGQIYMPDDVGARLGYIMIPVGIWIAAIIAGFVLSVLYPLKQTRGVKRDNQTALKKLRKKVSDENLPPQYKNYARARFAAYCVAAAFAVLAAIMSMVYLFNTANFQNEDFNGEILAMLKNVLPWVVSAFALFIIVTALDGFLAGKQLPIVKNLLAAKKGGTGEAALSVWGARTEKVKEVLGAPATVWAVRGVLLVIAITFIVLGAENGGARDVLIKAINICTECIGLG